ncbi:3' terminal RNA ribose 2'-O-methyltransferase Hen1, partial [bacterium]
MILTLSTTHTPATDLGYLLHKNPGRIHTADFPFGVATVLYPEATEERCTAALLVEVDPIRLVRGRSGPSGEGGELARYVNDRPYCANSFLAIAMRELFSTAMGGRSKDRPELAETAIPLEIGIPALRAGDPGLVRALFEPLGYTVEAEAIPLDETHPEWGDSRYVRLTLSGVLRLADALNHLYVLIPALDGTKHYAPDERGDQDVQ